MFKVFQIELSDEKAAEVNAAGCWSKVAWSKTYLDLTTGMFSDSDNVSVMEIVLEAIEFGLVKHTMTIDCNNFEAAFALGNGAGDQSAVSHHARHKSASVGDIFICAESLDGAVVKRVGFEPLSIDEVKEIETLVPQKMMMA